jgi:hypothetical protein
MGQSELKKRAIRRHHRNRIILKRYEKVKMGQWHVKNPGHLARNNTVCSCWMCGNPRKYFEELTVQERKSNQVWPVVYEDLPLEIGDDSTRLCACP